MFKRKSIKRYVRQIIAFMEKNLLIDMRVKSSFLLNLINPLVQLFLFIFIFGLLFNVNKGISIGYWNGENFILFLLLAFCVQYSKSIIDKFNQMFRREKYWKTLSAIMLAPVNRFTLLLGILASDFIVLCIPLGVLFIIAYILFPIPLIYFALFLLVFFSIYLTFGSIGLLIGVFGISHEELVPYLKFILRFIFLFSCISYPMQIFPEIFQFFVSINPLYYFFDLLRLTWYLGLNYQDAILYITLIHIIIAIILPVISPIIAFFLFEKVYRKYGITGY